MLGVGSGRRSKLRKLARAGLAVGVMATACGGTSRREDGGVGGSSAQAGAAPTGGTGGGPGSGGTTGLGCPTVAPRAYAEGCPSGLPSDGCRYELECRSGTAEFTYRCSGNSWRLEERDCARPFDACDGGDAQVQCRGGLWTLLGTGGDGPLPCPNERPESGAECSFSAVTGPPFCGFPCDDGAGWTVGSCQYGSDGGRWLFDSACPGDCGGFDRALLDYLGANSGCETDADCHVVFSACSLFAAQCSGAYVLGPSGDDSVFEKLDAELSACAETTGNPWTCITCNAVPPTPRCNSGYCGFAF